MPYSKRPGYQDQQAMAAALSGRIYPLICTVQAAVAAHTMGTPVRNTSGMRIVRPAAQGTFNAEAIAIWFTRPVTTTDAQSSFYFSIDRQGDTLGMQCMGGQLYGPIPIHPDVEYVSFFSHETTANIVGGWAVRHVHDSLNF